MGFDENAHTFWVSCIDNYGMEDPKEIGAMAAKARGEFELFLKQDVDDCIARLNYAPEIDRTDGVPLHRVCDSQYINRDVVVLRPWEAKLLRERIPHWTRVGRYVYYTGTWESIPLAWAPKDLHDISRYPYVHDAMLPQHRLGEDEVPDPLQNDYPVWYFLTGEIAQPAKLQTLLKLERMPYTRCATVCGLTTLQHGKFEATVETYIHDDYRYTDKSVGIACLIKDIQAEERLRYFKTDQFRVTRCKITLCPINTSGESHEIDGLTFVINQESSLFAALEGANLRQVPDVSENEEELQPSLAFEGYEIERPPDAIMSFAFPLIKDGRECNPMQSARRRHNLRSADRHRSPLVPQDSAPSVSFPLSSASKNKGKKSVSWSGAQSGTSGSHLRRSMLSTGNEATGSWADLPVGITQSASRVRSENAVEHIEDVGSLKTHEEKGYETRASSTTTEAKKHTSTGSAESITHEEHSTMRSPEQCEDARDTRDDVDAENNGGKNPQ